jgi:quercetin dioxygenase-like cupin family protein
MPQLWQTKPMEITRRAEAIFVDKGNGTSVHYYIYPEYEIHYNEVLPRTVQQWHHHEVIEETLYIVSGQLEAYWSKDDQAYSEKLNEGDIIRVGRIPHTFANLSDEIVQFLVFRMIPDGADKREIIKNDKVIDAPPTSWDEAALLGPTV